MLLARIVKNVVVFLTLATGRAEKIPVIRVASVVQLGTGNLAILILDLKFNMTKVIGYGHAK